LACLRSCPRSTATRAETGIFRRVDESARGDHFAGVWAHLASARSRRGMFLTQQHDLKFHKLRAVLSLLPPIQRLETIAGRLVLAGLVLFTIGLAAGRHLPRPADASYWTDPKVVWSIFMWLVYLALLILRRMRVAVKSWLRHQRHQRVCVFAPDLLGHQPAFTPASSMNRMWHVTDGKWQEPNLWWALLVICHVSPVTFCE